jgi:pilus assembly protein TadC
MEKQISKKRRQITGGVSLTIAVLLLLVLYLYDASIVLTFFNELLLIALLIAITPSAVLDYLNHKWLAAIEDQTPSLVRGISESQETGVTLVQALDSVVENRLVSGPLAYEVKKLTTQMSWSLSFEDALQRFRDRIRSPIVNRFCALVLEASRSGGQIKQVFKATSGFMEEMREIDQETSSQMKPYIIIIYAAFLVFLFVSIILIVSFFEPLEGLEHILSPTTLVGARQFKDFFYRTMLVSALMGGLMAGKIGERRVLSGLKHSIIQLVMGYITFYIMIPPNWMVI